MFYGKIQSNLSKNVSVCTITFFYNFFSFTLKINCEIVCFRSFFKNKFKTPKRVDTNPDFHDVDDSDDEVLVGATPNRAPNNR